MLCLLHVCFVFDMCLLCLRYMFAIPLFVAYCILENKVS